MTKRFRSKDYVIFRVHYYPKTRSLDADKHRTALWELAKLYTAFKSKVLEHFTGKAYNKLVDEFGFYARECGYILIERSHGILRSEGEGKDIYCVPVGNTQAVEWFKNNTGPLTYKIIKWTYTTPFERYLEHHKHCEETLEHARQTTKKLLKTK